MTSSDSNFFHIPAELRASDLCKLVEEYLQPEDVKIVYQAFLFGADAHEGQTRLSGEPYIFHPISVSYLLGQMRMDVQTLAAALLHDVIEDTGITKVELAVEFGEKIANIVDGVSKLNRMAFENREEAQAASFQKMMLAMSQDIRVIIVKLADRIHNMLTISAMRPESQKRIARETLEIYAPIASRLGMHQVRLILQERSFAVLYPRRYRILAREIAKLEAERSQNMDAIKETMKRSFEELHLKADISIREPNLYTLYQRMRAKKMENVGKKSFFQVTKKAAFRVIVDTPDACYRVLGVAHSLCKVIEGGFKDYISIPKVNGYQSLHTELYSPYGQIEMNIYTETMFKLAEKGITSYGLYKFDKNVNGLDGQDHANQATQQAANDWLNNLRNLQDIIGDNPLTFLTHVKQDLYPDEVFVFTPQGRIIKLPFNSTPVDFAYAVHTDVGNHCIAAKIDQQYVPLNTKLVSGQTVEILTANWGSPNPKWLESTVTGQARSQIFNSLKYLQNEKAYTLGVSLLNRELSRYDLSVEQLTERQQRNLQTIFKIETFSQLLVEIGLGNLLALVVASQLAPLKDGTIEPIPLTEGSQIKPLVIRSVENMLVKFATCCYPIPYEAITGVLSKGKGITIHQTECRQLYKYRNQPDRILFVEWDQDIEGDFLVDLRIEARNEKGLLARISTAVADMGIDIEKVNSYNTDALLSVVEVCLYTKNRDQLAKIIRNLRRVQGVNHIRRVTASFKN